MSDTAKAQAEGAIPDAESQGAAPTQAEAERDGFGVVEALNAENAALKDRVLRTLAEMENLRRRTERETADSRTYAVTAFARDMLNVADNLARALGSVPESARSSDDEALKTLIDGVELTARDLGAALGRHGVKKLEPQGEKFDPNFHQAMFEIPDESLNSLKTVGDVVRGVETLRAAAPPDAAKA